MARPKKAATPQVAGPIALVIQRDGVFIASDVRKDKGDECEVEPEVASLLIERGHAKPL